MQCNLAVVPQEAAAGLTSWCDANAHVAPLLARGRPGDPRLPELGVEIDVRTDLPGYRVMRRGEQPVEVGDLHGYWDDDLVAFAFGCSFSLEDALRRAGVELAYERRGFGGAIYRTTIETRRVGDFGGPLIASMRPLTEADAERAVDLSRRLPQLHGAPVHVGAPAAIGVDLSSPLDAIGAVDVAPGEVPVFWACGVTLQDVLARVRPRVAITHVSSQMLVTDLLIDDLAQEPAVTREEQ